MTRKNFLTTHAGNPHFLHGYFELDGTNDPTTMYEGIESVTRFTSSNNANPLYRVRFADQQSLNVGLIQAVNLDVTQPHSATPVTSVWRITGELNAGVAADDCLEFDVALAVSTGLANNVAAGRVTFMLLIDYSANEA